jgi:hypothetical protein
LYKTGEIDLAGMSTSCAALAVDVEVTTSEADDVVDGDFVFVVVAGRGG